MEVFYVLSGMILFAAVVGLYNLFFCCKSNNIVAKDPLENLVKKESKSCNEIKAQKLEEESRKKAEKCAEEFLKNNPDKYKFVVTLKDGTEFESEIFESNAIVNSCGREKIGTRPFEAYYSVFFAQTLTAKQAAENAKEGIIYNSAYVYQQQNGFLKVGDVEINVNEILLKEVVKV